MNNLEEGVEFLPAMNSKKMEKRGPKRRVVVTVVVVVFLLISLVTGLLVWHFKCEYDVWRAVARRVIPWGRMRVEKLRYPALLTRALPSSGKAPGVGGHHFQSPAPIAVTGDPLCRGPSPDCPF